MKKKTTKRSSINVTFSVKKIADGFRIELNSGIYVYGHINLLQRPGYPDRYETHSKLNYRLHGKGYGIKMYAKAIDFCLKKNLKVCSSNDPSDDAVRLLNSKRLRSKYKIHKRGLRYHVVGKICQAKQTKHRIRVSKYSNGFRVSVSQCGHVNLVPTHMDANGNCCAFETHSWFKQELRGKGLGIAAYSCAIEYCLKRGYGIRSSTSPSNAAIRVWKSKRLRSKYKIHKRGNRFCVIGKKV